MAAPTSRTAYVVTDTGSGCLAEFRQSSADKRDYTIDFTTWLNAVSDTITGTPTWTVPPGLTASSPTNTTLVCNNFFSGGTPGVRYQITVDIVTVAAAPRNVRGTIGLTILGAP
jgi:hypothetical protein